jgi:hypothetical protein
MTSESKEYTSSEVYSLASNDPIVFARVIRLPYLLASLLNWRSTSRTLLQYLIGVLENGQSWVEISHAELSDGLWPELHIESGKNKLARWLASFDDDQQLSGFSAIARKKGRMLSAVKIGDKVQFIPSKYKPDRFWDFVEIVGCRIVEQRALELGTVRERAAMQRWIVASVLTDIGASPILPGLREDREQQKQQAKAMKADFKKAKDAKEGRIELTVDEVYSLPMSETERFDVLLGQCLLFADKYFDMAESIGDFGKAYSAIESASNLFEERRERSLERLRGWEKTKQEARKRQLKNVA